MKYDSFVARDLNSLNAIFNKPITLSVASKSTLVQIWMISFRGMLEKENHDLGFH